MPPQEQHVSILFADICDSMPLYQASGDAGALAMIADRLDGLAALAVRFDGDVIRSKGDDVLCTFRTPTSALDAAAAMIEAGGPGVPAIHVGIHFGPLIRARDDIFGDAVNTAARILSLAKPGEIVASRALVDALPAAERTRLAFLGTRALKGIPEPIDIYSMVLDEGDSTQIVWGSDARARTAVPETIMATVEVEVTYRGKAITIRDGDRCLLGRADRAQVVIPERCVSREHAWVEVRMGRATVTDQSSTGTWIVRGDGGHTTLRRDTGALRGRGTIRLGRHPSDPESAPEIGFEVRQIL